MDPYSLPGHYGRVPVLISSFIFIPNILLTVIHSSISSFLRFTPPGGLLTYGQTSRGGYTSGIPTQSCTANMAPRPGYGIPLDSISPMAAPGSEIERLPTLFIGGISWKNSQGSDQLFNFWLKPMKIQENILASRSCCRARKLAIVDEADRLREQQEIELEQHRLQTLKKKESSVKMLWK
ncbi:hypothetical protein GLOIN_2v1843778 [Rhizophagus irregularis DAOM 181602=DAOM 197198]|uniref:Uncharacterized protein n=1 Tax=Rhizophagus irregularis (strain DAOM 181602 / DAOM 197198 / MUCL 43194) TaxID=747089 RepID=A0A2P4PP25_RHIID|nr:hypothetical protein GLOIN_2v1843778 [Rhizophagus irregularis DAOM 181602=DAOM 197198]POG67135.1 hypothetical protein GLOIN_2v1843778 [Rhizophagus irregularis DAOM 181602=DAOM 197198]|eukprot:XP_025174001.1 hypothetical protein GLOIN_2v1843778 [Rhizophagus irregularis DAOM 181602=DAOM 197198]